MTDNIQKVFEELLNIAFYINSEKLIKYTIDTILIGKINREHLILTFVKLTDIKIIKTMILRAEQQKIILTENELAYIESNITSKEIMNILKENYSKCADNDDNDVIPMDLS